jgi:adhesin transport system outer membrane protein
MKKINFKNGFHWMIVCSASWLAVGALIAPGAVAGDLKLSEALRMAGLGHPSVQAKISELQAANKEVDSAKWGRFPSLSVQGTSSNAQPQAALVIQQPVWEGGRIDAQIQLAQATVRQAEAALLETRQSLLQQTGSAFFEVLRLRERLVMAQKSESEHQKLVDLIGRRVKTQISPEADAILAKARKQQSSSDRMQVERSLQTALLTLNQLVGPNSGIPQLPREVALVNWPDEQWVESSKSFSGELSRLRALVDVAEAQVQIAKSTSRPGVYLVNRQALGGSGYATGGERNQTYLSMNFSPGAGLSAASAADAAKARMNTAGQGLALYERQLEQQVRNNLSDERSLQLQRNSSKELVKASEEVVASYLRQYQIGRKNWLDVLNALRESIQAVNSAGEIEYGLQAVKLRLLLSSGQVHLENMQLIHD